MSETFRNCGYDEKRNDSYAVASEAQESLAF